MKSFKIEFDSKHTIWYRTTAYIYSDTLEDAKRIAKEMYKKSEIDELENAYTEPIYDTVEQMSVADNSEEPTEELFVDGELVLTNLSEEDTSDYDDDDDPAFDHIRDEERNFIAEERERENESRY